MKVVYSKSHTKQKEAGQVAKTEFKTIAQNKKAYHDYFVEETLEAGIAAQR